MKKFILAIFMVLLSANIVLAVDAGTVTSTQSQVVAGSPFKTLIWTWTASAAGALEKTISSDDLAYMKGYYIYWIETNPGATSPTDNYDIVLNSSGSADILRGKLINRDETNTEVVKGLNAPIDGTALTLIITNNIVNAANGTIKLYLAR